MRESPSDERSSRPVPDPVLLRPLSAMAGVGLATVELLVVPELRIPTT